MCSQSLLPRQPLPLQLPGAVGGTGSHWWERISRPSEPTSLDITIFHSSKGISAFLGAVSVIRAESLLFQNQTLSRTITPTLKNLFLISGNPSLLPASQRLFIPSLNTSDSLFLSKIDFDVLWISEPKLVAHKNHFPFPWEQGGLNHQNLWEDEENWQYLCSLFPVQQWMVKQNN